MYKKHQTPKRNKIEHRKTKEYQTRQLGQKPGTPHLGCSITMQKNTPILGNVFQQIHTPFIKKTIVQLGLIQKLIP